MERTKVDANTLLSIGYEPDYHQLQPYLYMGLMSSDSKNIYFNKNIRDKYPVEKIKDISREVLYVA